MATFRILVIALFALSLPTLAFAADAGADPFIPPEDANASDADASDATDSDVSASDASGTDGSDDAGPVEDAVETDATETDATETDVPEPSGQFSESECWDEMCPDQINACKADPVCTAYAGCLVSPPNEDAQACMDALVADQGEAAVGAAQELYGAIGADCGWEACATNEGTCAGTCGDYLGATVCNCDALCWQYNDCCEDICDVCGANYPDECGTACQPDCEQKQCGPDGCGGSCGACALGQACNPDGLCGEGCENQCTDGETGCDGDVVWSCGMTAQGCTDYGTVQDCAETGLTCLEGLCIDPNAISGQDGATSGDTQTSGDGGAGDGTGPSPDGGTGTGGDSGVAGGDTASSGSGSSGGGGCGGSPDGGPLGTLIASLLALGLITRRRTA